MSVRRQRHKPEGTELQLTAFINPMVVLVTFLLVNVVFSHSSVLDLRLPAPSNGGATEPTPAEKLLLEVTVRAKSLEIGDRNKGPIVEIPNVGDAPDYARLSAEMVALKQAHPDETEATVLLEPDVSYDKLVQVMDSVRAVEESAGIDHRTTELFPKIAVGDAPVLAAATN